MGVEEIRKSILIGPLLFDVAVCILLGLLFILVPELSIHPYQRGFFCNDESIRLPYKKDTISPGLLVAILLVIAVGIVVAVEVFRDYKLKEIDPALYTIRALRINRVVVRCCTYLGYCLIGLCFEYVICEATKLAVGRLRPNFIDVCRPNIGWLSCNSPYIYITNYTCTSTFSAYLKKEAHVSFFSGHTAVTIHVVTYCVIYLYVRLPRRIYGIMMVPIIQTILVTAGLLVGYSRISDHKHHWSDVFAGIIVGTCTGSLSAIYLARLFQRRNFFKYSDQTLLLVDANCISHRNDGNRGAERSHRLSAVEPANIDTNVGNHPSGVSGQQIRYLSNFTGYTNEQNTDRRPSSAPTSNRRVPIINSLNPNCSDDYSKTEQIIIS